MGSPSLLVLMGVSGVGKTTVGRRVAERLGWAFVDADDLHPQRNLEKMRRGEGLTDTDREPWLHALEAALADRLASGVPTVLACSALKAAYRARLGGEDPRVALVWLDAPHETIAARLESRGGHFAGPDLLPSQLEALEAPTEAEARRVPAEGPPDVVARAVVDALRS